MPDNVGRDPDEVAGILTRWLIARRSSGDHSILGPDWGEPLVTEVEAPASNGFSNETILCRVGSVGEPTRSKRLVIRVAPTKNLLFLDADFSVQYRVMRAIADARSPLPLPKVGPYEEDQTWLGVPFFSMDHEEGQVPADNLPYTMEGWVLEGTPEQQTTMWWSGIEALAEVHRTDWRALGLDWLVPGSISGSRPGLDHQLDYYRRFLDWTAKGRPQPVAEAAWTWLLEHRPEELGDVVLCWGDARLGNVIWRDFRPAAVLDWEMATLAQPELDLGWWLYFDRQFSEGLGVPRPPGFPSREETIERYEGLVGRPMADIAFYEVFSGFRFAVIMCRLTDLLVGSGVLPQDTDMGTNNLATQFTAALLGLPAPAAGPPVALATD